MTYRRRAFERTLVENRKNPGFPATASHARLALRKHHYHRCFASASVRPAPANDISLMLRIIFQIRFSTGVEFYRRQQTNENEIL